MLAIDWPGGSRVLEAVAAAGAQGMVTLGHCEDHAIIEVASQALRASGRTGAEHYPESRPPASERAAVERLLAACEVSGAPVYVVHLSSATALDSCRRARVAGLPVFVETRPLYLALTAEVHALPDGAKYAGMPPVRAQADVEALWAGLADGSIDTVGSDHAPWTLEQKLAHADDLDALPKGLAELETMLPVLWTEGVRARGLSLQRLAEVTSGNAARIFGLEGKGRIQVGADADLVVVDPAESRVVDGSRMTSKAGYSVLDGRELWGWPRWTVSRGDLVLDDGRLDAAPGRGRAARRTERAGE
ncbi:unannotated protein [freshwater metagenome]|uniref:Unannotated protein n=1 Tax=freshwater metagenome TaxID=449393 RepID=A0A6J6R3G3_9ZZZZ